MSGIFAALLRLFQPKLAETPAAVVAPTAPPITIPVSAIGDEGRAPSLAVVERVLRALQAGDPKGWALFLTPPMQKHGINQPRRIAAFLATLCHESLGMRILRENLNYSVEALIDKFGKDPRPDGLPPRITLAQAIAYGRIDAKNAHLWPGHPHHPADQKNIAMLVYGGVWGRINLGNRIGTDDPWVYIGAGPPQLTGYANHKRFADTIGKPVESMPALLAQPGAGSEAAAHFWAASGCNPLADDGDIALVRRRFAGGSLGLAEVEAGYRRALGVLV